MGYANLGLHGEKKRHTPGHVPDFRYLYQSHFHHRNTEKMHMTRCTILKNLTKKSRIKICELSIFWGGQGRKNFRFLGVKNGHF